jgi:hypothetical protein
MARRKNSLLASSLNQAFLAIGSILTNYPLTMNTYRVLLSLMIGNFRDTLAAKVSNTNHYILTILRQHQMGIDDDVEIKIAGFLPVIFKLLLGANSTLRQAALQDINLLLTKR